MIRLLARATILAVVAGFALTRLLDEQRLLAWELVLIGIVFWQIRDMPSARVIEDRPLLDLSRREPTRLPRGVSSTELSVLDALGGHLGPERRLQPALHRIAAQRLTRSGIYLESPAARDVLGEKEWAWLTTTSAEDLDIETLESVVSRLEGL
jgi:hypothetical protein